MNGQKLWNRMVAGLLRSRFHRFLSKSTLLITFTGCKSGKTYTTPLNYLPDGKTLLILSRKDRTWWKNLRGGASVTVRIEGEERRAMGKAFEDPQAVAEGLLQILQRMPQVRRHFKIFLTRAGQPEDPEAFARVVQSSIIVRITELEPRSAPPCDFERSLSEYRDSQIGIRARAPAGELGSGNNFQRGEPSRGPRADRPSR